jgi:hypothetical protein
LSITVSKWLLTGDVSIVIEEHSYEDSDGINDINIKNNIICDASIGIPIAIDPSDGSSCPICGDAYNSGVHFADVNFIYMLTNTDADDTLRQLDLLNRNLKFDAWEPLIPEEVPAYLHGKNYGISIADDMITFGDELIDQESMEVLCM